MAVKTLSQSQVASVSGGLNPIRYIGDLVAGYVFGLAVDGARNMVGTGYTPGYTDPMGNFTGDGN
jgi:hypothetical protein